MENKFINHLDEAMLDRLTNENADFLNEYLEENGYDLDAIKKISEKKFKRYQEDLSKYSLNN